MAQRKMGKQRSIAIDETDEQFRRLQIMKKKMSELGGKRRTERDDLDFIRKMRKLGKVLKNAAARFVGTKGEL